MKKHQDDEVVKNHLTKLTTKGVWSTGSRLHNLAVALLAIFTIIFVYFLSQIMGLVILALGGSLLGKDYEDLVDQNTWSTVLQFSFIVIVELVSLYAIWIILKIGKIKLRQIGLGRWPKADDIKWAVLTFLAYFVVFAALSVFIKYFITGIDTEQEQQLGFENVRQWYELSLVFIGLVVLVPFTEEVLVRGFLYSGLRKAFSIIPAAASTSVLFGIAHLQLGSGAPPLWIAAIDTAVLSLFLIYLREKTGSLWAGVLLHSIKNGLAFVVLFIVV